MKHKTIFLLILLLFFIGCSSDNFYDTKRILQTDKNEYKIGDTIQLTLKILPTKTKKEIRVYENYKNLEISFSLVNDKTEVHNINRSKNIDENLPKTKINDILITKEKPFIKIFTVPISSINGKIMLEIPELKIKAEFDSTKIKNNNVRIHGFCNPINPEIGASLEEYFEIKDIKINVQ